MSFVKNTYHIIALTMAYLMFFSSVGITIDMHYCNGELKSVNFFGKAKTCHETASTTTKTACSHHQKIQQENNGDKVSKYDCCKNKTATLKTDNDRVKSDSIIPTSQQFVQFAIAYVLVFHTEITTDKQSIQEYSYQPPIISRDIYVLSEAFLL